MSCSGTQSLMGESATNSSVDIRPIDDGLLLLPTPDSDAILSESMKHDPFVEKDQNNLIDESTVNGKKAGTAVLYHSLYLEDAPTVTSDSSVEYSDRQRNGDISQDASPVTSETEKPSRSGIAQILLLRDEEYLRLVFDGEAIHEHVQFEVPEGKLLSELFLTSYYGEDDVAFYGIKAGCCDTWTAEHKIIPYLEAWSHIGPTNLGSNILSYSENVENTNTLPQAVLNTSREYTVLRPGTYVLLVQNANISGARYDFLFKLR